MTLALVARTVSNTTAYQNGLSLANQKTAHQLRASVDPAHYTGPLYLQVWEWSAVGAVGAQPSISVPLNAAGYAELDFGETGRDFANGGTNAALAISSSHATYTQVNYSGNPIAVLYDAVTSA